MIQLYRRTFLPLISALALVASPQLAVADGSSGKRVIGKLSFSSNRLIIFTRSSDFIDPFSCANGSATTSGVSIMRTNPMYEELAAAAMLAYANDGSVSFWLSAGCDGHPNTSYPVATNIDIYQ